METRRDELDYFKTDINLSAFAASAYGYELDQRYSSPNAPLMKNASTGDKIVLGKGSDGHWTYFSVKNGPHDSGSIIDFCQFRNPGMNLGAVRVHLRPYATGAASLPPDASLYVRDIEATVTDLDAVRANLEAMDRLPFGQNAYLNNERGIPASVLSHPVLEGRILLDERGNVVFPHSGTDGLPCGGEVRNHNWKGFMPHGTKGLWWSRRRDNDNRLVICESGITAVSWATLHGLDRTRLFSTGGSLNPVQPELIKRAISRLPFGTVHISTDADDAGDLLAEVIESCFAAAEHRSLKLIEDRPDTRGLDWNDVLKPSSSAPTPGPS